MLASLRKRGDLLRMKETCKELATVRGKQQRVVERFSVKIEKGN